MHIQGSMVALSCGLSEPQYIFEIRSLLKPHPELAKLESATEVFSTYKRSKIGQRY